MARSSRYAFAVVCADRPLSSSDVRHVLTMSVVILDSGYRPKSRAGIRTVTLPQVLIEELPMHMATYVGPEDLDLIFTGPKGATPRRGELACLGGLGRPGRGGWFAGWVSLSRPAPHGEPSGG